MISWILTSKIIIIIIIIIIISRDNIYVLTRYHTMDQNVERVSIEKNQNTFPFFSDTAAVHRKPFILDHFRSDNPTI